MFARFFFHPMLLALEETGDEKAKKILSGIKNMKGNPSATLGKVMQALGETAEGWHTAMADVQSTVKAFRGIILYVREHIELADTESYGRYQAKAFKVVRDFKKSKSTGNPGTI
jgi:hypothetical protein